jgi:hypothetical protein
MYIHCKVKGTVKQNRIQPVYPLLTKVFLTKENTVLLLINLAQHGTPPAPYLGQGFET